MTQEKPPSKSVKKAETRADRLKNALKANLSRRKAQTRARSSEGRDAGTRSKD